LIARWKKRCACIANSTREIQADGASADEAGYAAQKRFGNTLRLREEVHQAWGSTAIDELGQDLRYGMCMLRKSPVFTLVVVVTLGLGIGATTAVYSVVDRILFRALPYADADRVVSVGLIQSLETEEFTLAAFSSIGEPIKSRLVLSHRSKPVLTPAI
jgi:putative ABC transport system permease protein